MSGKGVDVAFISCALRAHVFPSGDVSLLQKCMSTGVCAGVYDGIVQFLHFS